MAVNNEHKTEDRLRRQRQARLARERRRRKKRQKAIMIRAACVVVFLLLIIGIVFGVRGCLRYNNRREQQQKERQQEQAKREEKRIQKSQDALAEAQKMAAGYDYDGAIRLLKGIDNYEEDDAISAAVTALKKDEAGMVTYQVDQVEHYYFNTLVVDEDAAASSDKESVLQANQETMTVDAFNQTIQKMYEDGYVLVSIHDLVKESESKDKKQTFKNGTLRLPAGKKPFVLSQNDVSYPFELSKSGRGSKMIVGQDGKVLVQYEKPDGSVEDGDYDVVPCLDTFIENHPDFSYHGARGILGLSGYNGVLGYRTDETLGKSMEDGNVYGDYGIFDVPSETEGAKKVIKALAEEGWEFACNGYEKISYASTFDRVKADVEKWEEYVGPLIEGTDILLYPGGYDIDSWTDYSSGNQKYKYLKSQGFKFFCNIDQTNDYWLQIRSGYLRQARKKTGM